MAFFVLGALLGHLLYWFSQASSFDLLPCFAVACLVTVTLSIFAWLVELLFVRRY